MDVVHIPEVVVVAGDVLVVVVVADVAVVLAEDVVVEVSVYPTAIIPMLNGTIWSPNSVSVSSVCVLNVIAFVGCSSLTVKMEGTTAVRTRTELVAVLPMMLRIVETAEVLLEGMVARIMVPLMMVELASICPVVVDYPVFAG